MTDVNECLRGGASIDSRIHRHIAQAASRPLSISVKQESNNEILQLQIPAFDALLAEDKTKSSLRLRIC